MAIKVDRHLVEEAWLMYSQQLMNLDEVGVRMGVPYSTLRSRLIKAGYKLRPRGARTDAQKRVTPAEREERIDTAWKLYSEGASLAEIGVAVGVYSGTIRSQLVARGYQLRGRDEARKHLRMRRANRWQGGRLDKSSGYVDLRIPGHRRTRSNGYVFEHIVVWERANGRPLPDGWHVHHANGIKNDNRPENLVGMPSKDHYRYIASQTARIRELEAEVVRLTEGLLA